MAADLVSAADERLQHMGSWMEGSPPMPSTWYSENLHPRSDPKPLYQYNIIKRQKDSFFRVGRVFRCPWSETAGTTAFSTPHRQEEFVRGRDNGPWIYQKNREFVVVRANHDSCGVLPITTYGHQGVAKPSVDKSQHGIVYMGKEPPALTFQEDNRPGLVQAFPIRVIGDQTSFSMDMMSRINYGQVHTVHHNVQVESIGMVHPGSIPHLLRQFINVWVSPLAATHPDFLPVAWLTQDPEPSPSSTITAHSPTEDLPPGPANFSPQAHHHPLISPSPPNTTNTSHEAIRSTEASFQRAVGEGSPQLSFQPTNPGTENSPRRSFQPRRGRKARYSGSYHNDDRYRPNSRYGG